MQDNNNKLIDFTFAVRGVNILRKPTVSVACREISGRCQFYRAKDLD